MLLGRIADDLTGASDFANTLARAEMAVAQYGGVLENAAEVSIEAGVIALKSRSIPKYDAILQ